MRGKFSIKTGVYSGVSTIRYGGEAAADNEQWHARRRERDRGYEREQ